MISTRKIRECITDELVASMASNNSFSEISKRNRNARGQQQRNKALLGTPLRGGAVVPRRRLFSQANNTTPEIPVVVNAPCWSAQEYLALVKFLLLYSDGKKWIAIKDVNFWAKAGQFIKDYLKTSHQRSGSYIYIYIYIYMDVYKLATYSYILSYRLLQ